LRDDATALDDTGAFNLPDALIADLRVAKPIVPSVPAITNGYYYISRVQSGGESIHIYLGFSFSGGGTAEVGVFQNIPVETAAPLTGVTLTPLVNVGTAANFNNITGAMIAGLPDVMLEHLGQWSFGPAATRLNDTTVDSALSQLTAMQVGAQLLTGNIVLREGAGVTLSVSGNIVTISASPTAFSGGDIPLSSNTDVINALTALYGRPITSVNGVMPDSSGSLTIATGDGITVEPTEVGLKFSNPGATPCCGDDYLQNAMEAINQLNANGGRLSSFYEQVSKELREMRAKLVKMERQTRIF
jgi:hypothetical protein